MVLYADIAAAYYAAVRELSTFLVGQCHLSSIREGLNLHPEDECSDCPVRTNRGTRPGSCFADLLFGTVLKRVIQCRDAKRDDDRHRPTIEWDGHRDLCLRLAVTEVPMIDVVWADDLAEAVDCCSASECPQAMEIAAGCLSKQRRQSCCADLAPGRCPLTFFRGQPRFVCSGSTATRTCCISCHATNMLVCSNPLMAPSEPSSTTVGGPSVPRGERFFGIRRLILTPKGASCAPWLCPNSSMGPARGRLSRLGSGALSMARCCFFTVRSFQSAVDQHLHASTICSRAQLPSPGVTLYLERCRYLRQLIIAGPNILWALVKLDGP